MVWLGVQIVDACFCEKEGVRLLHCQALDVLQVCTSTNRY